MSFTSYDLASELRRNAPSVSSRESDFLSMQELADYLGVPLATIRMWRCRGIGTSGNYGPPGIALGRRVIFARADVANWLDSMKGQS